MRRRHRGSACQKLLNGGLCASAARELSAPRTGFIRSIRGRKVSSSPSDRPDCLPSVSCGTSQKKTQAAARARASGAGALLCCLKMAEESQPEPEPEAESGTPARLPEPDKAGYEAKVQSIKDDIRKQKLIDDELYRKEQFEAEQNDDSDPFTDQCAPSLPTLLRPVAAAAGSELSLVHS